MFAKPEVAGRPDRKGRSARRAIARAWACGLSVIGDEAITRSRPRGTIGFDGERSRGRD